MSNKNKVLPPLAVAPDVPTLDSDFDDEDILETEYQRHLYDDYQFIGRKDDLCECALVERDEEIVPNDEEDDMA